MLYERIFDEFGPVCKVARNRLPVDSVAEDLEVDSAVDLADEVLEVNLVVDVAWNG